jgi:hypothetical protein
MAERILTDDDVKILSDRLENVGAVTTFLGEASQVLLEREQPMTSTGLFGMYLTFQWITGTMESIQDFIRKEPDLPVS